MEINLGAPIRFRSPRLEVGPAKKSCFRLELGFPECDEELDEGDAVRDGEWAGPSHLDGEATSPPCPLPLPKAGFETGGLEEAKGTHPSID